MSEEIKRKWDGTEIAAVRAWHDSAKGFHQVEKEINLPAGTLFKLVNEIPDYRGTRRSVGKWLRRMTVSEIPPEKPGGKKNSKKTSVTKKTSLPTSGTPDVELQLRRELEEALRKIERLESRQKKDDLRREFLEGQLEEYRKLVKPSQSKKSNTK